jgi:Family of unknown function (DUF6807)
MKAVEPAKTLPRAWSVLFIVLLGAIFLLLALSKIELDREPGLAFVEDAAAGTLTITDKGKSVLTYRFGDRLPAGIDAKQTRSCYIHPLYSLDGETLTDDFPGDHLHHHGLFWAWPIVEVRGVRTSNWEPAEASLRQHFVRWVRRDASKNGARLVVENVWKLKEKEDVLRETVEIMAHPAIWAGRAIDIEISLRPLGGPLELRGAPADNKGYGGLCFRAAPGFHGAEMTTDQGRIAEDSVGKSFLWADLSTDPDPGWGIQESGVAIFVHPGHPDHPLAWLVRNSYAGVLNPSWPGLEGKTLAPETTTSLRYRIYVHRGDAAAGRVKDAYEAYIAGRGRGSF